MLSELCLLSRERRRQQGLLLGNPSWDGTGDCRAAPLRQVPSFCPLCLPSEALPCPGCQQRNPACSFRSLQLSSLRFQLSKQNLWSPAGTLVFVFQSTPSSSAQGICGMRPRVCSQQKSLKPLYKQSVVQVVAVPAVTTALFCAAAKCRVPGAAAFPQSLPSCSHQPHAGENSVLVEI